MNTKKKELAAFYEEFLRSIKFANNGDRGFEVDVLPPMPRKPGDVNAINPFAQPWSFFIDLRDDGKGWLREYLLWVQHFAVSEACSFSVHSLALENSQTWKTLVLLREGLDQASASHIEVTALRDATLNNIKDRLREHGPYLDRIRSLAANHLAHTGSAQQVFKTVTDTFHLSPLTADTKAGPVSALLLTARPISDDTDDIAALKALMIEGSGKGRDYLYVDTCRFTVVDDAKRTPPTLECKLCKADIHRTADCPLPKTRRWKGITPTNLGLDDESKTSASTATSKDETPKSIMSAILTSITDMPKAGPSKGGSSRSPQQKGKAGRGNGRGGGKRKPGARG